MRTVPFGHLWPDGRLRILISIFQVLGGHVAPRVHVSVAGWIFPYVAILNAYGGPHPDCGCDMDCTWKRFGEEVFKGRWVPRRELYSIRRQLRFISSSMAVWLGPPTFNGPENTKPWPIGWVLALTLKL